MDESVSRTSVNYELLDNLVQEYLIFEGFSSSPREKSKSGEKNVLLERVQRVRQLVSTGKILEALETVHSLVPAFSDIFPSLVFRAKLQQFIELVRASATDDARKLCCHLAPAALLTPTAYEEFSRALLLLLFKETDEKSPVKDLWDSARLESLADDFFYTLSRMLGIKLPRLHVILTYLITVHNVYHFTQGKQSPVEEVEQWLSPQQAPAAASSSEQFTAEQIDAIPHADIYRLTQTVGISREAAIRSILRNGGFLGAIHDELSRMRLNKKAIVPLLLEYASSVSALTASASLPLAAQAEALRAVPEVSVPVAMRALYMKVAQGSIGSSTEVTDSIAQISPQLMRTEAPLLLRIHMLEMRSLDAAGQHDAALKILREKIAPLCYRHESLRSLLSHIALTLVAPKVTGAGHLTASSVARTIVDKLATSTGSSQPRLIFILKALLRTHAVYFDRVRVEEDRLLVESAEDRQLAALKMLRQSDTLGTCDSSEEIATEPIRLPASAAPMEHDGPALEEKISSIMELLAVSRPQAMRLYEQFDGNLENILASAFDEAAQDPTDT